MTDKAAQYRLTYNTKHNARIMLWSAKKRAQEKELPFDLTEDDIVIPDKCPVLGIKLEAQYGRGGLASNSPSLDRIYPWLGYVKGNVIVISHRANRLKNDATPYELHRIASFYRKLTANRRSPEALVGNPTP